MVKFFKTSLLYGLLIVLSSALPQWAAAQSRVVSGTVKDEKGTGLPGVTIIVKGTAGGTTSMADGQYSVKVSAGDELEFSFIGYASQTVRIGAQSVVDITLQEQSLLAEEVVVTAYAVQKKVNVTGSISQVKGTDLVATPVANISVQRKLRNRQNLAAVIQNRAVHLAFIIFKNAQSGNFFHHIV